MQTINGVAGKLTAKNTAQLSTGTLETVKLGKSDRPAAGGAAQSTSFSDVLQTYTDRWQQSDVRLQRLETQLPKAVRPVFQLQVEVQLLTLQTHLLSAAGEGVAATVKRVQQLGSN